MGIELLISILILALIAVVVFYVIDILPLPAPAGTIAKLIVGLLVLLAVLQKFPLTSKYF